MLPQYFTEVFPAKTGASDYPLLSINLGYPSIPLQDVSGVIDWLDKVNANYTKEESDSISENEMVSWSAFYSSRVSNSTALTMVMAFAFNTTIRKITVLTECSML